MHTPAHCRALPQYHNSVFLHIGEKGSFRTNIRRRRWGLSASVSLHAAAVGSVVLCYYVLEASTTLLVGGLIIAGTYIGLGIIEGRRAAIWISPLSFYLLCYSVKFGIAATYMSTLIARRHWVPFVTTKVSEGDIATAYVVSLIGSLAFHAGLQILRPMPPKMQGTPPARASYVPLEPLVFLWVVGLVVIYRPSMYLFLGSMAGILALAPYGSLFLFALLPPRAFRLRATSYWKLLCCGTLGLLSVNFAAEYGSKAYVIFSFAPMAAAMLQRPRLRRWILPSLSALMLFYLLVVAPAINLSRTVRHATSKTPLTRVTEAAESFSPIFTGQFEKEFLVGQVESFLFRVFEPTAVGFLVSEANVTGFQYGGTMSNLAYAFIPRAFWPGKPVVNRGAWFTTYLRLSESEEEAVSSTGMFPAGELYWNFGLVGVVVGMLLLGFLYGGLWRMAGFDPRKGILNMLLYVGLTLPIFEIAEASSFLVGIVIDYLFFGLLLFLQRTAGQRMILEGPHLIRPKYELGESRFEAIDN